MSATAMIYGRGMVKLLVAKNHCDEKDKRFAKALCIWLNDGLDIR